MPNLPTGYTILNKQNRVSIDRERVHDFLRKLRTTLKLGRRKFNVCFVDDARIAEMNDRYRRKSQPTDVLSFPWNGSAGRTSPARGARRLMFAGAREFEGFLGDIVISAQTARRNARSAGRSTAREIRWLILHGVLHLLGYDHETDEGEMTALELALRKQLEV